MRRMGHHEEWSAEMARILDSWQGGSITRYPHEALEDFARLVELWGEIAR